MSSVYTCPWLLLLLTALPTPVCLPPPPSLTLPPTPPAARPQSSLTSCSRRPCTSEGDHMQHPIPSPIHTHTCIHAHISRETPGILCVCVNGTGVSEVLACVQPLAVKGSADTFFFFYLSPRWIFLSANDVTFTVCSCVCLFVCVGECTYLTVLRVRLCVYVYICVKVCVYSFV